MRRTILAASLFLASALPAVASNCLPRPVMVEGLASKYGEYVTSRGLGGDGMMIEMYASPETGTWSVVVTSASGLACLVASGTAFEAVSAIPPDGDPA